MTPLGERIRDIQLPPDPPVWPLAPGWWLLLGLLLVALGLSLFYGYRRGALRRAALRELGQLEARFGADGDCAALALGLSTLLRRLALSREPRTEVAGLSGEAWLAYLDRRGTTKGFSAGEGRVLLELPYRARGEVEVGPLLALVRSWIHRNS
jgi:hypothetical protein